MNEAGEVEPQTQARRRRRNYLCGTIFLLLAAASAISVYTWQRRAKIMPMVDVNAEDHYTLVWDVGEQKECFTWSLAAIVLDDGKATLVLLCGKALSGISFWTCWDKDSSSLYDTAPPEPCRKLLAEQSRLFPVRLAKGHAARANDFISYYLPKRYSGTTVTRWQCTKEQDGSINCR